jgi:8-oxo-(d)GTP phosphatase
VTDAEPQVRAAGGVLWRRGPGGGREWAVIHRPRYDDWSLPKGKLEEGESLEVAALREVLEETGLEAKIVKTLDTIEYFFRAGDVLIKKRVDFYLMQHTGGALAPQLSEVDDVEWVPLSESVARASFDSEKKLLEVAAQELS